MSDAVGAASPGAHGHVHLAGEPQGSPGEVGPPRGAPRRWGWERGDAGEEGSPAHLQAQLFSGGKLLSFILCHRPALKRATLTAPRGPP